MRVVVVSPETIHHRDADETRRLQRLLGGLAERGHDVTVCCARWWSADAAAASTGEDVDDATVDGTLASGETSAALDDAGGADGADGTDEADSTERSPTGTPDGGRSDATNRDPTTAADDDRTGSDSPDELAVADDPIDRADRSPPGSDASRADGSSSDRDEPDSNEGATRTVTVDGITYRAVVSDPANVRGFAARAPLSIRRAEPDVIHAVATPPASVVAARAGGALARAPVLAEWYDPSRDSAEDWTTRQALHRPARIVTPSRLTRRQLVELGADDARLRVVPNAIDVDQIRSVVAADDADVVYARHLDADANVESLFLGLAELRDREWSATVVGDGPERATYEQQARDLRIDDRVTFVGACDREERLSIYRGAHAFVQTARRCVFPTELCWALACGCVGIVEYHADSGAHELVEGRDRGFRTTNPQETAQAIRDAAELERLTVDDSFASYDESTVLEQYETLYEEVHEEWGWF